MPKTWLAGLAAALVLVAGDASAATFSKQDVVVPMDDGVPIAATLYLPDGSHPPDGWPAIVVLHGLAGDRAQTNALVEASGLVGEGYAVLTVDARGHGASGGVVSFAGQREVADLRALHAWLGARADVADGGIGALGISYGGGAILNALAAGVPWRAVFTIAAWTDLGAALAPDGLVKSALVAGLLGSIPPHRLDPSLAPVVAAALAGSTAGVRAWAAERSSVSRLGSVTTPVFMAQGRRDFLFGIDHGTIAFQRLQGQRTLYLGQHGHAPSSLPAADAEYVAGQARAWFGCHLRDVLCDPAPRSVLVASESVGGRVVRRGSLPPTVGTTFSLPGVTTFAARGRAVRTTVRLRRAVEVFGAPTVVVSVAASGGWSRLVATLAARTPQGREITLGAGGFPLQPGAQKVTIRLPSQATYLPRASRLTLTLGSSQAVTAGSPVVYLDLPQPRGARLRVGTAVLRLPGLRTPVTR